MKRCLLGFLILCTIFTTQITYVHAEDDLQLYAKAAVLMDADSGRILFAKNGQEMMPMASTTKIMTCILALEYADYDDEIVFSETAVSQPKVHLGAARGETFLLRDLLYSLMLESHNDTAVAVAEGVSGSVQGFTELMNAKAKSIGCKRTHFVTPNGLDASNLGGIHATTASELARIMKYCIYDSDQREEFLQITRQANYSFSNVEGTRQYGCHNHNAFLQMMSGALSGKTGFTANAGYCYVGALEDHDRTFIVALLACGWPNHKGYKWSDTQKLMQYGMDHYQYVSITIPKLENLYVDHGRPKNLENENAYVGLKYRDDVSSLRVLIRDDEKVVNEIHVEDCVRAPVERNQRVGKIQYKIGNEILASTDILSVNRVDEWNFAWAMQFICTKFTNILK